MSKPYDASGKDLFEFAPAGWHGTLGQPRPEERLRVIDADLFAMVSTATDKVIFVEDPQPWQVMIELQANWDGDRPYNLLKRYSLLKHRHGLPVSCTVVLMRPEANSSGMRGNFSQPNLLESLRLKVNASRLQRETLGATLVQLLAWRYDEKELVFRET